ncbi:MAG: Gfo/Idh/MocA family oxidoreductase [Cyclobacteriaceae bacterium]
MISSPDIDLVIVNTPNETHMSYAQQALESGKHVVVEKPFTVTVGEAETLIRLSKKVGKVLTVYHNRRLDGSFLTLKRILEQQLLGSVVEASLHYDRFRNYIQPATWKEEANPGVGILYNLGSHMLDQVLQLFGQPAWVDGRVGIQRPGGRVPDYYDVRLEYADKLVVVKSSYLVREAGPQYAVHGVTGSYVKFGIDPQEQALIEGRMPEGDDWGIEPEPYWGTLHTEIDGKVIRTKHPTERGDYRGYYDNLAGHSARSQLVGSTRRRCRSDRVDPVYIPKQSGPACDRLQTIWEILC